MPTSTSSIAANLSVVWPNLQAAGAQRLILTRAVHEPDAIRLLRKAVPDVELTIVQIVASYDTIRERLEQRDTGAESLSTSRKLWRWRGAWTGLG